MLTRTRFGQSGRSSPAIPVTRMTSRAPASRASTDSTKPETWPTRGRSSIGAAIVAVRQAAAAKPAKAAVMPRQIQASRGRRRSRIAPAADSASPVSGAHSAGSASAAK